MTDDQLTAFVDEHTAQAEMSFPHPKGGFVCAGCNEAIQEKLR